MVKWYYRSVFDELEDLRRYRELLDRQIYGTNPAALLPATAGSAAKMLPPQQTTLPVDVSEKDDEFVITADMMAGVSKRELSLDLIDSKTLEITWERTEERADEIEGYSLRERAFGSMTRIVTLQKPVTDDGSSATFKNGVLEVHLKKITNESGRKIPVD